MTFRIVCLAMGLVVAGMSHAEAKMIYMGPLSRPEVKAACERAGGRHYGIEDLSNGFGCHSPIADVSCNKDGLCNAYIGDTRPLTGNSLDYVLTYGAPIPPSKTIQPESRRIEAINAPARPLTSTGCYGVAYTSPGCAGEPPPQ